MSLYLDTSLLVAAATREARGGDVRSWLDAHRSAELSYSPWVVTEFSSALSVKTRSGEIAPDERADALATFTRITAETFVLLSISEVEFHTAARFADHVELGVRSGDALHLAIVAAHGATLCTLDRRLAAAGPPLGVKTLLV